jgi:hypothetical protein
MSEFETASLELKTAMELYWKKLIDKRLPDHPGWMDRRLLKGMKSLTNNFKDRLR